MTNDIKPITLCMFLLGSFAPYESSAEDVLICGEETTKDLKERLNNYVKYRSAEIQQSLSAEPLRERFPFKQEQKKLMEQHRDLSQTIRILETLKDEQKCLELVEKIESEISL